MIKTLLMERENADVIFTIPQVHHLPEGKKVFG